MTEINKAEHGGFYDSVCTCSKCDHKTARECCQINCKCCKSPDHSMIMDGLEGFERKS